MVSQLLILERARIDHGFGFQRSRWLMSLVVRIRYGIGPNTLGHKIRDPLRDDLSLPRTSRRDDLHVRTTMPNRSGRVAFKSWCLAQSPNLPENGDGIVASRWQVYEITVAWSAIRDVSVRFGEGENTDRDGSRKQSVQSSACRGQCSLPRLHSQPPRGNSRHRALQHML